MLDVDFSNSSKEEIDNFYKTISNNVRKHRLEKGLSQEKIALDIGIKSIAFYSNCENNKYNKRFNLEHLYKIAKALNIRIEELFSY
ncbi:helix-turn-helix transcriptional regulator [Aliarcobacter skirrowii]|uniref:Transcriptional regulator, XRE family n=1 Tax=Aliarcobacter skirrowii CCUG 10374 TaxID=1032239 RepID=A0AAD0WN12_9BACT|nr:helix-turn-helix transcriptional regulator [Aliarcobacter skirrowii]AXX84372.1 transcriptional regulator, XRE family [Aliarcobacter skirrowii CCUG 10374]KAB0621452.1 helix-turn-helix transcriptional regulator [Aliarcobacter skirrowii CCUG 10374]MDD3025722.1 helix-turn-helix transcriptional regulator [Aliarcobacter skirrowii]RXI26709.1 XRE family transcriptional regulator [Aliarcobacter skirrowii CCUG 10374]SUV14531.1 transcriptional regulator, y4mF family [Aliarcobacter skirrowii]